MVGNIAIARQKSPLNGIKMAKTPSIPKLETPAAPKMSMSVPILHKGGVMKKDGLALLKKGETVRTPEQEKKMAEKLEKSSAKSALTKDEKSKPAAKKDKKKKKAHKVEIEKKKGGFLVRTHHEQDVNAPKGQADNEPEESVHPDLESIHDHLEDVLGGPEEAPPSQGGTPPAAPAGPGV